LSDRRSVKFNCVGCGACCKGRYIPLTLEETKAWLLSGHEVSIIIEALGPGTLSDDADKNNYYLNLGIRVRSGRRMLSVLPIFAANAINGCPNLDRQNSCTIYEDRPPVCRVYPQEISPYVLFKRENKECPPEAWQGSSYKEIIDVTGRVAAPFQDAIAASRKDQRSSAYLKGVVCELLGISVAAWKGNGFTIFTPERGTFLDALEFSTSTHWVLGSEWQLRVHGVELASELFDTGHNLYTGNEADHHVFIPLGATT
jgi:Fe-S-cluster containining protein